MAAAWREPRRTGTERVMCLQGCSAVHMTTASIRRDPLPMCGGCGSRMWPEHPQLAEEVMPAELWPSHPWLAELERKTDSVARGQASHVQRGRQVEHAETVAADHIAKAWRAATRARRRSGLAQYAIPAAAQAVAVAEMPF